MGQNAPYIAHMPILMECAYIELYIYTYIHTCLYIVYVSYYVQLKIWRINVYAPIVLQCSVGCGFGAGASLLSTQSRFSRWEGAMRGGQGSRCLLPSMPSKGLI